MSDRKASAVADEASSDAGERQEVAGFALISASVRRRAARGVRGEAEAGDVQNAARPVHAEALLVISDELGAIHQRVSPTKCFAALRRIGFLLELAALLPWGREQEQLDCLVDDASDVFPITP
jgi:hypothetical protein